METIQWTMTIPKDKQKAFTDYYHSIMLPTWLKFGAVRGEIFKVYREKVNHEDTFPEEQFVELLYLEEGLTAKEFFEKVKAVTEAWEISRQYEKQFGATDVVMKVLQSA